MGSTRSLLNGARLFEQAVDDTLDDARSLLDVVGDRIDHALDGALGKLRYQAALQFAIFRGLFAGEFADIHPVVDGTEVIVCSLPVLYIVILALCLHLVGELAHLVEAPSLGAARSQCQQCNDDEND